MEQNINNIVDLLVKDLNKRLSDRELSVEITDKAKDYITEQGYDPVYGARPLKRYIQKYVETAAAKLILGGDIGEGDVILIDYADGELKAMRK